MQVKKFCLECNQATIHDEVKTNHVLHFVLSILTLGFWLIIWLLMFLMNTGKGATCQTCGTVQK